MDKRSILERHRKWIMSLAGVSGVAVGLGTSKDVCILVYVEGDTPPPDVPRELEGCPVEIVKNAGFASDW